MSVYKLETRGQRIQGLLSSFPAKATKYKSRLLVIDSSFRRMEMEGCSKVERNIFNSTVKELLKKERAKASKEMQTKYSQSSQNCQKKLSRYVHKAEEYQAMNLPPPSVKKQNRYQKQPSARKIYLQRKYNSKLVYQIHNIIEAKRIETSKQKTKKQLDSAFQSPLVRNTAQIIRTSRNTDPLCKKQTVLNNFVRSGRTQRNSRTFNIQTSSSFMTNEKIKKALDSKEEDVSPVALMSQNTMKRYSSSLYFSTVKTASKPPFKAQ